LEYRNFDINWDKYWRLPFSVKDYWNGKDYGYANNFMMPFYIDPITKQKVYDPSGIHQNHIFESAPDLYDYKGEAPFSESETQLIRDLFYKYKVVGFIDFHMNPWQNDDVSYTSRNVNRKAMMMLIDRDIKLVNVRNPELRNRIPNCHHLIIEDYDHNAPCSINWPKIKWD
jgi:hypothetical protein